MSYINDDGITIHTAEELAGMRVAGRLAAEVLDMIGDHVKAGAGRPTIPRLP